MILAILNQKGGVGKTTTGIKYLHALAEAGQSVQVLDADSQQQAVAYALPDVQVLAVPGKTASQQAVAISTSDWTIIDCPPSLLEAAPAIPLADLVIAPVPPCFQDLSGSSACAKPSTPHASAATHICACAFW